MFDFLDFAIDRLSFIIGFTTSLLAVLFWKNLRQWVKQSRSWIVKGTEKTQVSQTVDAELQYRQDVVRVAQESHLVAPLFSLDEIAIPPRLIAPLPLIIPGEAPPPDDVFSLTIPYQPDWPELAAAHNVPTLSMAEAFSGGADMLLIGVTGSGKSFALNYFASQVARQRVDVGNFNDYIPVLIHVADMHLPADDLEAVDVLCGALREKVSGSVEPRMQGILESALEEERVLLIVDGLDELPATMHDLPIGFLRQVKEKFPGTRLVVAGAVENYPGVASLDLTPVSLAAWGIQQVDEFILKWSALWDEHVLKETWAKNMPSSLEPWLVRGWLRRDAVMFNPMLLTLRMWGIFAGDIPGPSPGDALNAYIHRMSGGIKHAQLALERLAAQMALAQQPAITRRQAGRLVSEFEEVGVIADLGTESDFNATVSDTPPSILNALGEDDGAEDDNTLLEDDLKELEEIEGLITREKSKLATRVSARKVRRMLPELVKRNILVYRPDSKISFTHPLIAGYLAGCGLANQKGADQILGQPDWPGKTLALEYLAVRGVIHNVANKFIENQKADPLRKGMLAIARWPRNVDRETPWWPQVMRSLVKTLENGNYALGLRCRLMTALATSGDASVATLFRQMLTHGEEETRLLGALGCGIMQDEKAVEQLSELLQQGSPTSARGAAIALIAINTSASLEAAASALLNGNETVRRAIAEAFSQHYEEGHSVLQEGSGLDDLHVRRAVVYGLALINEPWVKKLVRRMQLEDNQWAVRSAAEQILSDLEKPNRRIPTRPTPLAESPWLIAFASERGRGISHGQSSWDMLRVALREGNTDQRLAAMDRFRYAPNEAQVIIPDLYQLLSGRDKELRDAAYDTLWCMAAAGINLPPAGGQ